MVFMNSLSFRGVGIHPKSGISFTGPAIPPPPPSRIEWKLSVDCRCKEHPGKKKLKIVSMVHPPSPFASPFLRKSERTPFRCYQDELVRVVLENALTITHGYDVDQKFGNMKGNLSLIYLRERGAFRAYEVLKTSLGHLKSSAHSPRQNLIRFTFHQTSRLRVLQRLRVTFCIDLSLLVLGQ